MVETNEAIRFFEALRKDFDIASPLRWSFLLDGATTNQVGPLMEIAGAMGFTEVEPMADEENDGQYTLWVAEVCVHSAASFAQRVDAVEHLAAREGLVLSDYSAGLGEIAEKERTPDEC